MADVKWIKVATDIFDDEKIQLIESMPDADALIVIWFKLLVQAGKCNASGVLMMSGGIPYTDEMLATLFRRPLNTVRLALSVFERYGMIEYIDNAITITNWGKHQNLEKLENRREYMRDYMKDYRQKQKLLVNNVNSLRKPNVNALEQEQDIDIDIDNSCCSNDLMEMLTADEIKSLYSIYESAGELIDAVGAEIRKKKRSVKNAYRYIIGYATNKGWSEKDDN